MGEFADSTRWTLVNGRTLHTDHSLHDRPMMLTSVPKSVDVDIDSFEVVRFIDWPDVEDRSQHPGTYADKSYLKAAGSLQDRIVVFDLVRGELATFREISDITIRPTAPGRIGGRYKASFSDGIGYSGMSSQDVPEGGLMVGEPGRLHYLPDHDDERRGRKAAHLSLTVYLDEDKLAPLLREIAAQPDRVRVLKLHVLLELFETETSASLSEPWMRRDYGLLMQSEWSAATAARLEAVNAGIGHRTIGAVEDLRDAPPAPAPASASAVAPVPLDWSAP